MDETQLRAIAQQLRHPAGEQGPQVGQRMNVGNRYLNLAVLAAIDLPPGGRVLEIGMGNGFFVPDLLARVPSATYVGVDQSAVMVEEARRLNAALADRAEFHPGTAAQLPFADGHFDFAFAINVLYFWETPARELAELRRVLRPGGQLLLGIRPRGVMEQMPFTRHGFTLYTPDELRETVASAGFTVAEVMENEEPDQEFFGQSIAIRGVVLTARR
jgi:SAM-dependent methyltransferase